MLQNRGQAVITKTWAIGHKLIRKVLTEVRDQVSSRVAFSRLRHGLSMVLRAALQCCSCLPSPGGSVPNNQSRLLLLVLLLVHQPMDRWIDIKRGCIPLLHEQLPGHKYVIINHVLYVQCVYDACMLVTVRKLGFLQIENGLEGNLNTKKINK